MFTINLVVREHILVQLYACEIVIKLLLFFLPSNFHGWFGKIIKTGR